MMSHYIQLSCHCLWWPWWFLAALSNRVGCPIHYWNLPPASLLRKRQRIAFFLSHWGHVRSPLPMTADVDLGHQATAAFIGWLCCKHTPLSLPHGTLWNGVLPCGPHPGNRELDSCSLNVQYSVENPYKLSVILLHGSSVFSPFCNLLVSTYSLGYLVYPLDYDLMP